MLRPSVNKCCAAIRPISALSGMTVGKPFSRHSVLRLTTGMPRRLNAAASSLEWRKRINPSPVQFSSMTIGAISLVESKVSGCATVRGSE
ncbi:MAG: hypothetical protein Ct9H300mP32_3710 [Verrucomicrobiota bacterium]|nr:MAG: hypothetical protein Ct9H300mP32_3710 [Verrucomicrobiota bacterium]